MENISNIVSKSSVVLVSTLFLLLSCTVEPSAETANITPEEQQKGSGDDSLDNHAENPQKQNEATQKIDTENGEIVADIVPVIEEIIEDFGLFKSFNVSGDRLAIKKNEISVSIGVPLATTTDFLNKPTSYASLPSAQIVTITENIVSSKAVTLDAETKTSTYSHNTLSPDSNVKVSLKVEMEENKGLEECSLSAP
ncbi:hypothetical protein N9W79_02500, partial [bacterium]|nr:hypothetical protein [bacterium]